LRAFDCKLVAQDGHQCGLGPSLISEDVGIPDKRSRSRRQGEEKVIGGTCGGIGTYWYCLPCPPTVKTDCPRHGCHRTTRLWPDGFRRGPRSPDSPWGKQGGRLRQDPIELVLQKHREQGGGSLYGGGPIINLPVQPRGQLTAWDAQVDRRPSGGTRPGVTGSGHKCRGPWRDMGEHLGQGRQPGARNR